MVSVRRVVSLCVPYLVAAIVGLGAARPAEAQVRFEQSFENVGARLPGQAGPQNLINQGWIFRNQSQTGGINYWREGDWIEDGYVAQSGAKFLTTASSWDAGTRRISTWAILPSVAGQQTGDVVTFFVRGWAYDETVFQLRYSPGGGTGTGSDWDDVGDFTTQLAASGTTNSEWTQVSATVPGNGRLAIRVFDPQVAQFVSPIMSMDSLTVSATSLDAPFPGPGETVIWTQAMSPVRVRSVETIPIGATLIIEPGVVVEIEQEATIRVGGTLTAIGTPAQPIDFNAASVFPPAIEVINGVFEVQHANIRGQLRPQAGANISILDSHFIGPRGVIFTDLYIGVGFGRFERVTFTDSEFTISNYTLVLRDLTLNNTFARWNYDYIFMDNIVSNGRSLDFGGGPQGTLIDSVSVIGNAGGYGLGLGLGNFFIGPDVTIQGNNETAYIQDGGILPGSVLPATGNTHNRVFVPGGDHGFVESIWADAGIPYYISAFYAQHGGSLSIREGVNLRMAAFSGMAGDPSYIELMGTEERPVLVEQDVPGGRWYPLQNVYRFRHVELDGAIRAAAWPSQLGWGFMDSSIVRNCSEFGVTGQGILRKTQLLNNGVGADVSMTDDLLGFTNPNAFEGNGIGVADANNATYNWWGSPNGPTSPQNPGGDGDPVAQGVPFIPFLTERPDYTDAPPIVDLEKHSFIARPGQTMVLCWDARDDGRIETHRVIMSLDGDVVQGNLFEPVITLAEGLPAEQRCIEFIVPEPAVRFFGSANIRVETTDDLGQVGWDDLHLYIERDEPGQLVITTNPGPEVVAGQDLGQFCWNEEDISPIGGSVNAYLLLENTGDYIGLGGVTTYLNCLALNLEAPYVSTDRARLVVSLFTGGGVNQPEFFYGDPFAIRPDARVGDAAPSINMTSPAPGASYAGGSIVPITWTAADDQFVRAIHIQASTDGGRTWSFIAQDLPGNSTSYNWRLPPSSGIPDVRLKVVAVDRRFQDSSSLGSIQVTFGSGPGPCPADFNQDTLVTSADITSFLSAWFADLSGGTTVADFNQDGLTTSADITAFLNAWFIGVGGGC